MSDVLHTSLFRCGLAPRELAECILHLEERYPDHVVVSAETQGYCSLTFLVGEDLVIQLRPPRYAINVQLAEAAKLVYGSLAPETIFEGILPGSGLMIYKMERIYGVSYQDIWKRDLQRSSPDKTTLRATLCRSLAEFVSLSWHNRSAVTDLPLGRVGKSLIPRLRLLGGSLPLRFQLRAKYLFEHVCLIQSLPWVLTHGDLITANIMVNPMNGNLRGMVDWAEAEMLPFGTCFYGLEEVLGELGPSGFRYFPHARELRDVFWVELRRQIPDLRDAALLQRVKLARELGILLWHGIAFDEGKIDRVVQEGRDVEEIQRLDAFFGGEDGDCLEVHLRI